VSARKSNSPGLKKALSIQSDYQTKTKKNADVSKFLEDELIRRESDNLTFGKNDGVNTNKISINSIASPVLP